MKLRFLTGVFCLFSLTVSNVSAMCQCDNVNPAYVQMGEQILKLTAAKVYKIAFRELQSQYPAEFAKLANLCHEGQDLANTDLGELLGDAAMVILAQNGLVDANGKPNEILATAIKVYTDVSNGSPDAMPKIIDTADAIKMGKVAVVDPKEAQSKLLVRTQTQRLSRAGSTAQ